LVAKLTNLLCKIIFVCKFKIVTSGWNVAESSIEGCGSKRGVLPVVMTMVMNIKYNSRALITTTLLLVLPIKGFITIVKVMILAANVFCLEGCEFGTTDLENCAHTNQSTFSF
jgi:Na+/glutamate symporter